MATLDLGLLKVTIGADTSPLDKAEKEAGKKVDGIKKKSDDLTNTMVSHATKISAAFVVAMTAVGLAINNAISNAVALQNLATSLGVSVEGLSRLEYAAKGAGLGADQLKGAFSELTKKMLEREPVDLGVRLFSALGVTVTDTSGRMRNAIDVFGDVADRFSRMSDGAAKTNLAMQLFGGEGAALIPVLNQGSEGLKKMYDEADRLGVTVDGNTAQAFKSFMNEVNKTRASVEGIFTRVAASLTPALSVLNDQVSKGVGVFKDFGGVQGVLTTTLKGTIAVLYSMGQAVNVVYQGIAGMVEAVYQMSKGEFGKAWDALTKRVENVKQVFADAEVVSATLFGGWEASINKVSEVAQTKMPPIVQSVEQVNQKLNEFRNISKMAMEDLMNAPTETIAAKMAALEEMVRRGGISWREYLGAVRQVNTQSKQQMNDMLSATSQVLTALFSKSKAAAIASALINTYQGITKAIAEYPPPISYAMAAAQAALGFAQINAIRNTNSSSSGGAAPSVSAPSTPASTGTSSPAGGQGGPGGTLMVQGISADSLFSGDAMRGLAERLLEYQRNGGKVVLAPM